MPGYLSGSTMSTRLSSSVRGAKMTRLSLSGVFCLLVVAGVTSGYPTAGDDDKDWWKNAIVYQIYPRSFKDYDNDGIGDLPGINEQLIHLKNLGATAAWLSPIYKSPMVDTGYDISDYRSIQPEYGTMQDFDNIVQVAKEFGIKIIMDFVPNHTSNEHEWFNKSANREPGYENYYVWLDGRDGNTRPPNNWVSYFGGPAWTYNEARGQWYLHQFAFQQPDLNYREPKVVQEMKDVMTFWLDKGVDGFRVDTIPSLFERGDFPDEPLSHDPNSGPNDYGYLVHIYTNDQPETFDMVYQWRAFLDAYQGPGTKVLMTESYSEIHKTMQFYCNETVEGAHFTFNFLFITELNADSSAQDMAFTIEKWMTYMPAGHVANWVLGNHDQHRVATRYGSPRADGLNMLQLFLPGVKVVFNGEEIGMEDGNVTYEQGQDPQGCNAGPDKFQYFSRDFERTPFQWDDTVNAGFNEGHSTWLPVSDKYVQTNVKAQNVADLKSHYNVFVAAAKLRSDPTLKDGDLMVKPINPRALAAKRELDGQESKVFVFNIGERQETVDLTVLNRLPDSLNVLVASSGSTKNEGDKVQTNQVFLDAYEALILSV